MKRLMNHGSLCEEDGDLTFRETNFFHCARNVNGLGASRLIHVHAMGEWSETRLALPGRTACRG